MRIQRTPLKPIDLLRLSNLSSYDYYPQLSTPRSVFLARDLAAVMTESHEDMKLTDNHSPTAVMDANKLPTTFLSLPLELRKQIYIYAFQRGAIYIHKFDRNKPFHNPDPLTYSLHPPYHLELKSGRTHRDLEDAWFAVAEHKSCCIRKGDARATYHKPGPDCPERLCVEVLYTCKQINAEASQILWTTNTFHFEDPEVFTKVLREMGTANRGTVKRLSLSISWFGQSESENALFESPNKWTLAISHPLVKELRALKTLGLEVRVKMSFARLNTTRYGVSHSTHVEKFTDFASLPLEAIDVAIRSKDSLIGRPLFSEYDRQSYGERIEAKLLENVSDSWEQNAVEKEALERYRLERQRRRLRSFGRRDASQQPKY